jgi:membrane protein
MLRRVAQDPARADRYNSLHRPFTFLPRRLRILFLIGHRVVFGFLNHNGMSYAAAMAFWLVLSLPPLVIAVSSVATALLPMENPRDLLAEQIVAQLPAEGGLIRDLVEREIGLLSVGGFFSLVFLMFSGSRVFAALVTAIYVMWRHVEPAGFVRRELMRLLLVVIVGGMLLGSILAQISLLAFEDDIGIGVNLLAGWLLPFVMVVVGLFVTYKLLPRRRATWRTALVGAVIAAVGLRAAQAIFTLLLGTVLEFEEGYGPLAEVALLATWAFFASVIILLGAELVATLDRHRLPHVPLPSSARGAPETADELNRDTDRELESSS